MPNVLVARAGQPVSKEDLFAFVWNDTAVSDDALTSCVQELRRARSNGRNGAWLSIPDDMGTLVNAACLRARMGLRDEPRFKKPGELEVAPPAALSLRVQSSGRALHQG